ncbi:hypothetical protein GCT19_37470 [Paraburkholderia sp. CNPSo 3155]|uniref:hypothetical protein n=1 Tax=Paraburkholderia atlantica TaxID=2654982 RepID=UPI00128D0CB2|nr:hypothetical protein [Paraburkholderia atlantica]MPW11173.1 hypothetical protein [Paraburkholderia atlantica]
MSTDVAAANINQGLNSFFLSTRDGPSDEYLVYARKLVISTYQTFSSLQLHAAQAPAYRPWADRENLRHANEISWLTDRATELAEDVFPDLGIDPEPYRLEAENELDSGRKLRLVRHALTSWNDAIVLRYLSGLVFQAQAEATIGSNYIPYAVVAQKVYFRFGLIEWPAEIGSPHRERVARAIEEDGLETIQELVNKWWPRALDSFGVPGSKNDEAYVRLGLKTRSNSFTRSIFEASARREFALVGLTAPRES